MTPRLSVVVPVYNEGEHVRPCLDRITEHIGDNAEVLVVYDTPGDTTVPVVADYAIEHPTVRGVLNTYGRGPANAIRFGLHAAAAPVAVVTMADLSDDAAQIPALAQMVREGAAIGAASRYSKGGRQIGGPRFKALLSRLAGTSLYWLARVGTKDATNSFKAYDTAFVRDVGIESTAGFEIGIELVAKARRTKRIVREIPTVWRDRADGQSHFRIAQWLPHYMRWYAYAFGVGRPSTGPRRQETRS